MDKNKRFNPACTNDESSAWERMKEAEVRFIEDGSAENHEELLASREAWLISLDGVKHLQAHSCHSAARYLADIVMWRDWATSDNEAVREHCAAESRDLRTLLTLCADPVPEVARQAHATVAIQLGAGWWEKMRPPTTE